MGHAIMNYHKYLQYFAFCRATKVAKKPYCSLCSVTLSMSTSRQGIERWGFSEGANKICRVRGALVLTLVTLAAASMGQVPHLAMVLHT